MAQALSTVVGIIELTIESDRLCCLIDVESAVPFGALSRQVSYATRSNAGSLTSEVSLFEANLQALEQELRAELMQLRTRLSRSQPLVASGR